MVEGVAGADTVIAVLALLSNVKVMEGTTLSEGVAETVPNIDMPMPGIQHQIQRVPKCISCSSPVNVYVNAAPGAIAPWVVL